MLSIEHARNIPFVSEAPTLIIGMDVSHGSPGRADVPSIAAVRVMFFSVFVVQLFIKVEHYSYVCVIRL